MSGAPRSRRAAVLLACLAVAVGLSACTPIRAGSAATVGDQALSENTIADRATELLALADEAQVAKPDISALNQGIIAVWVDEQLTTALADDLRVTVTPADVDALLGQFGADQLNQIEVSSGIAPSTLREAATAAVLRQAIAQKLVPNGDQAQKTNALGKAYADIAERLGVRVNPRFGSWNAQTAQVDARAETLSRPAQTSTTSSPLPLPAQ